IVHHVAEMLYSRVPGGKITKQILDEYIIDESKAVERQITASINQFYVSGQQDDYTPLRGEALIQAGVIRHILTTLFRQEMQFVPFDFVSAEWRRTFQLDVDGRAVNFTLSIDRIDRVYGRKRIVDYKTGSDITWFRNVDQLFDNAASIDHPRGIFQLLMYCCAYAQHEATDEPLQPYLYSLRTMNVTHLPPVVIGSEKTGVPLLDYHDVQEDFWNRFKAMIKEMFDPAVPFVKAKDASACKYCKFTRLCGGV
ncbi:MAG: PD-(D/E)XK nuclease family protein, partial [Muribaculaceae bacterium]|nr:PD-(D/E)XK nuclease family protein [Muribaculaceae bacterium]